MRIQEDVDEKTIPTDGVADPITWGTLHTVDSDDNCPIQKLRTATPRNIANVQSAATRTHLSKFKNFTPLSHLRFLLLVVMNPNAAPIVLLILNIQLFAILALDY